MTAKKQREGTEPNRCFAVQPVSPVVSRFVGVIGQKQRGQVELGGQAEAQVGPKRPGSQQLAEMQRRHAIHDVDEAA